MPIPQNELVGLRIRVERLLRGDKRAEDLNALFLALRDYSGGRECVMEVGNFIAHRGERRIGITTKEARDFFITTRFVMEMLGKKRPPNLVDLPKNIFDLLDSAFRRTSNDMIRRQLKVNRQTAHRRLADLRSRLLSDAHGRIALLWPTDFDQAFLDCVLGHITARAAFTDVQLIEQLSACLYAPSLLLKNEIKTFNSLREFVGVFAVANMHLCVIDLGDGTLAELEAGATLSQGVIGVTGSAPLLGLPENKNVRVATTFFETNISVFDHATSDLHPTSDQNCSWRDPIELGPSGKLSKLA
jgi:hypothetical protein